MSFESVMPSNQLILCRLLLLAPSIFPSIRVFSNESVIRMRWPKYWSFNFSISPSNEYSGLISCIAGDPSLIPGLGRSLGEVNGNSLQYSCWRIKWTEEPGGHTTEQLHFQFEKLFSGKHNTLGTFDHLIFILDTDWFNLT